MKDPFAWNPNPYKNLLLGISCWVESNCQEKSSSFVFKFGFAETAVETFQNPPPPSLAGANLFDLYPLGTAGISFSGHSQGETFGS